MRTRFDISQLIASMAREEERLREEPFLAPCVAGGTVRVRVGGLVRTFAPVPADFEGWGVFLQEDDRRAVVLEEPSLPLVDRYLALLRPIRVVLALAVRGRTWLGVAANASDARQRGLPDGPFPVHLVDGATAFERVVARWDGAALWFESLDARADPIIAERLRGAAREGVAAHAVRVANATPEHLVAFEVAASGRVDVPAPRRHAPQRTAPPHVPRVGARLRDALERGGGALLDYAERGDVLVVEWTTAAGERHTSAVSKEDLTVVSSGICLSGRDRDFDLLSLVGVVEGRE
jgi:hypothetical protein